MMMDKSDADDKEAVITKTLLRTNGPLGHEIWVPDARKVRKDKICLFS